MDKIQTKPEVGGLFSARQEGTQAHLAETQRPPSESLETLLLCCELRTGPWEGDLGIALGKDAEVSSRLDHPNVRPESQQRPGLAGARASPLPCPQPAWGCLEAPVGPGLQVRHIWALLKRSWGGGPLLGAGGGAWGVEGEGTV